MDKMQNFLPKSIAITCGAIGLYLLFKDIGGLHRSILDIISGLDIICGDMPLGMSVVSLVLVMLIVFRIISSYGLYRLTSWGRYLTIATLGFDFLFRFAGFINMWTYYLRHPEKKAQHEELLKQLQQAQENGEIVGTISMMPTYVIALISFVSVILLLKNKIQGIGAQHLFASPDSGQKTALSGEHGVMTN